MWAVVVPDRPSLNRPVNASGATVQGSRNRGCPCPSTTGTSDRSTRRESVTSGLVVIQSSRKRAHFVTSTMQITADRCTGRNPDATVPSLLFCQQQYEHPSGPGQCLRFH